MLQHCELVEYPESDVERDASVHSDEPCDGTFECANDHDAWEYGGKLQCNRCKEVYCQPCFMGNTSNTIVDSCVVSDPHFMCPGCASSVPFLVEPRPAQPVHGDEVAMLNVAHRGDKVANMDTRCIPLLSRQELNCLMRYHRLNVSQDREADESVLQAVLTQELGCWLHDANPSLPQLKEYIELNGVTNPAIKDWCTNPDEWECMTKVTVCPSTCIFLSCCGHV